MQRLDHKQIWHTVRGSLAEAPVPIRLALGSECTIERRTAFDRLASFIALRVASSDDDYADDNLTLPLFPELETLEEEPQPQEIIMGNVIENATSFGRWLLDQRHREDAIGALAKQAWSDPSFPKDGAPKDVSKRLNALGADGDTHEALETAELDWLAL